MMNVNVFCFLASYIVAFLIELVRLRKRSPIPRIAILFSAAAGFFAHTLFLLNREGPPLLSSSQDWILVVAWVAVLIYLFLTAFDRDLAFGLFILPVVLVLISIAWTPLISNRPLEMQTGSDNWKMLHASSLALGTAGILAGFVLAMMYLVQHRRLKHKQAQTIGLALPSLENLARLNRIAVIASVPLLTVGILSGLTLGILSREQAADFRIVDPVVLGNSFVWLAMIVFFGWLTRSKRTAGRQVAWVTIWAFSFLVITIVALLALVGGGVDSFHAAEPPRSTSNLVTTHPGNAAKHFHTGKAASRERSRSRQDFGQTTTGVRWPEFWRIRLRDNASRRFQLGIQLQFTGGCHWLCQCCVSNTTTHAMADSRSSDNHLFRPANTRISPKNGAYLHLQQNSLGEPLRRRLRVDPSPCDLEGRCEGRGGRGVPLCRAEQRSNTQNEMMSQHTVFG
ncbi:MAG: hypothetical protein CMJ48_06315 [Planctomycetaceae bacterium]|nr:hypothetical protein [Planctomycetaceae bacterium]